MFRRPRARRASPTKRGPPTFDGLVVGSLIGEKYLLLLHSLMYTTIGLKGNMMYFIAIVGLELNETVQG